LVEFTHSIEGLENGEVLPMLAAQMSLGTRASHSMSWDVLASLWQQ
jgi:hypothetical protein